MLWFDVENCAGVLHYGGLVYASALYRTVREVASLLLHALNMYFWVFFRFRGFKFPTSFFFLHNTD